MFRGVAILHSLCASTIALFALVCWIEKQLKDGVQEEVLLVQFVTKYTSILFSMSAGFNKHIREIQRAFICKQTVEVAVFLKIGTHLLFICYLWKHSFKEYNRISANTIVLRPNIPS